MNWQQQYAKMVNALENEMYIFDDEGFFWYFDGEKIRMALADVDFSDNAEENGYFADGFEDALKVLKDGGYIE